MSRRIAALGRRVLTVRADPANLQRVEVREQDGDRGVAYAVPSSGGVWLAARLEGAKGPLAPLGAMGRDKALHGVVAAVLRTGVPRTVTFEDGATAAVVDPPVGGEAPATESIALPPVSPSLRIHLQNPPAAPPRMHALGADAMPGTGALSPAISPPMTPTNGSGISNKPLRISSVSPEAPRVNLATQAKDTPRIAITTHPGQRTKPKSKVGLMRAFTLSRENASTVLIREQDAEVTVQAITSSPDNANLGIWTLSPATTLDLRGPRWDALKRVLCVVLQDPAPRLVAFEEGSDAAVVKIVGYPGDQGPRVLRAHRLDDHHVQLREHDHATTFRRDDAGRWHPHAFDQRPLAWFDASRWHHVTRLLDATLAGTAPSDARVIFATSEDHYAIDLPQPVAQSAPEPGSSRPAVSFTIVPDTDRAGSVTLRRLGAPDVRMVTTRPGNLGDRAGWTMDPAGDAWLDDERRHAVFGSLYAALRAGTALLRGFRAGSASVEGFDLPPFAVGQRVARALVLRKVPGGIEVRDADRIGSARMVYAGGGTWCEADYGPAPLAWIDPSRFQTLCSVLTTFADADAQAGRVAFAEDSDEGALTLDAPSTTPAAAPAALPAYQPAPLGVRRLQFERTNDTLRVKDVRGNWTLYKLSPSGHVEWHQGNGGLPSVEVRGWHQAIARLWDALERDKRWTGCVAIVQEHRDLDAVDLPRGDELPDLKLLHLAACRRLLDTTWASTSEVRARLRNVAYRASNAHHDMVFEVADRSAVAAEVITAWALDRGIAVAYAQETPAQAAPAADDSSESVRRFTLRRVDDHLVVRPSPAKDELSGPFGRYVADVTAAWRIAWGGGYASIRDTTRDLESALRRVWDTLIRRERATADVAFVGEGDAAVELVLSWFGQHTISDEEVRERARNKRFLDSLRLQEWGRAALARLLPTLRVGGDPVVMFPYAPAIAPLHVIEWAQDQGLLPDPVAEQARDLAKTTRDAVLVSSPLAAATPATRQVWKARPTHLLDRTAPEPEPTPAVAAVTEVTTPQPAPVTYRDYRFTALSGGRVRIERGDARSVYELAVEAFSDAEPWLELVACGDAVCGDWAQNATVLALARLVAEGGNWPTRLPPDVAVLRVGVDREPVLLAHGAWDDTVHLVARSGHSTAGGLTLEQVARAALPKSTADEVVAQVVATLELARGGWLGLSRPGLRAVPTTDGTGRVEVSYEGTCPWALSTPKVSQRVSVDPSGKLTWDTLARLPGVDEDPVAHAMILAVARDGAVRTLPASDHAARDPVTFPPAITVTWRGHTLCRDATDARVVRVEAPDGTRMQWRWPERLAAEGVVQVEGLVRGGLDSRLSGYVGELASMVKRGVTASIELPDAPVAVVSTRDGGRALVSLVRGPAGTWDSLNVYLADGTHIARRVNQDASEPTQAIDALEPAKALAMVSLLRARATMLDSWFPSAESPRDPAMPPDEPERRKRGHVEPTAPLVLDLLDSNALIQGNPDPQWQYLYAYNGPEGQAPPTLLDDAQAAAWRTAASQFLKLVREPVLTAMARWMPGDPDRRAAVAAFLETELGTALLAGVLAMALGLAGPVLPAALAGPAARLGRELRVGALADVADVVADLLMGPLRAVVAGALRGDGAAAPPAAAPATLAAGDDDGPELEFVPADATPARVPRE